MKVKKFEKYISDVYYMPVEYVLKMADDLKDVSYRIYEPKCKRHEKVSIILVINLL